MMLPKLSTLLDARVLAAQARIYAKLGLDDEADWLRGEAEGIVRDFATIADKAAEGAQAAIPILVAGDETLLRTWHTTIFDLESERRHQDYLASLPSAAALLELLRSAPQEIDQHHLSIDRDNEVIWVTNPYGIDSAWIDPTVEALSRFLDNIKAGHMYGPEP
jgi:hypothetical protein